MKRLLKVSVKKERFKFEEKAEYVIALRSLGDQMHFDVKICEKSNNTLLRDGIGLGNNRREKKNCL